jgi:ssRNA-specific RNase YbeY (16S rRNA maturation enzyme)
MNFRVEYFDTKNKELKVTFMDAENSNELKNLWMQKHRSKGTLTAVCETKVYTEMLSKYGDLMRPLKG